jgi:hypothetical protein
MKVYVTTSSYMLGKLLGIEGAMAELQHQCEDTTSESLPCIRTIARLRELTPIELRIDTGGTVIAKVRSRHFHSAFESGADVWVSVDDDVEATLETLDLLLGAVHTLKPVICTAPVIKRGIANRKDIDVSGAGQIASEVPSLSGRYGKGATVRIANGGFGLIALNRAAMNAIVVHFDALAEHGEWEYRLFRDDDDIVKRALFREAIWEGKWYGEDLSFFRRVPEQVDIVALIKGHTAHDGVPLELRTVGT